MYLGHSYASYLYQFCSFSDYSFHNFIFPLFSDRQHWSLLRDVEVVMLNALMPWGNGHLFPRGPLREPLVAVSRADIVMIHNANMVCNNLFNFLSKYSI